MSNNSQVVVVMEGREAFEMAMRLAFHPHKNCKDGAASHYLVQTKYELDPLPTPLFETQHPRLIFFWHDPQKEGAQKLPFKMSVEDAIPFAWSWLQKQDYQREPDHDGDNGKGFAVYNEAWGHVGNSYYGICAISPQWAWYGK